MTATTTASIIDQINTELSRVGHNRETAYTCAYPLVALNGEPQVQHPAIHGYNIDGYIDADATLKNLKSLDRESLDAIVPGYMAFRAVTQAIVLVKPWENA